MGVTPLPKDFATLETLPNGARLLRYTIHHDYGTLHPVQSVRDNQHLLALCLVEYREVGNGEVGPVDNALQKRSPVPLHPFHPVAVEQVGCVFETHPQARLRFRDSEGKVEFRCGTRCRHVLEA